MTARKPSLPSVSEAARILGFARNTVTDWLRDAGLDYSNGVDIKELLKRKLKAERDAGFEDARKKYQHVEETIEEAQAMGWISEDEAKRRKLVAQMAQEEYKAAELAGEVVRISEISGVVNDEYAKVRGDLSLAPASLDHRLAMRSQDECRAILDDWIITVLTKLQADARYQLDEGESDGDAPES